ncbi:uncharacterized protein V1518DRAFT_421008 [Limtongia smithiae]|uniref:uncharacterized protein n=1 Tax=Limtongia smithiae TaxID=1125753 RepID=UPI0034D008F2
MSDASDDDIPLSKRKSRAIVAIKKVRDSNDTGEDSDSDEIPLKKRQKKEINNAVSKKVKKESPAPVVSTSANGSLQKAAKVKSENGTAESKVAKVAAENGNAESTARSMLSPAKKSRAITKTSRSERTSDDEAPLVKRKSAKTATTDAEKDEEDLYKWWEAEELDGSIKWTTLQHNGVLFPPPYEPLPDHVKLRYCDKPVDLPMEAEEVAGFFGAMLNTDHARNPVFQNNFFKDFLDVLENAGGANIKIEHFEHCDFTPIFNYYEEKRMQKKAMTNAEKKQIKEEKEAIEEKYKVCYLDGRKEVVGNFRIEPPGLFRGRGSHPKTGKLKSRVMPEQVTINIGPEANVPDPPEGHEWAEVKHDNTVSWLATWKENINSATKYVFLAANSSLKGMSDYKKFEKARELKNHIERIRKAYTEGLKDSVMAVRQRSTAMYLIDVLALRAGGEKGEDEADTVGCCSLRCEHISFMPGNIVVFDFLGKDSIQFYQEVKVSHQVYKNLRLFKRNKDPSDDLFDRLDPGLLNRHLQEYMLGLTAKVFRTYNASKTMQDQLDLIPNEGSVNQKYVAFNAANRAVAVLCNHQRTVSKGHELVVGKIEDKIFEVKWQRYRLSQQILELDPKLRTNDEAYFEKDPGLTEEVIDRLVSQILQRETLKITKKFEKDNEKRANENEEPMEESVLKERLEAVKALEKEYAQERKKGKPEVKSGMTVEKLRGQIEKLDERVVNMGLQLKDKEDNSTVALTTSKINYIDPRLTVMFSKKFDVPIEKLFSKTLREKFKWAIDSADENWRF